jgi:hypothetical protein
MGLQPFNGHDRQATEANRQLEFSLSKGAWHAKPGPFYVIFIR